MTVREAQSKINSREFAEWIAYYHVEPFGEDRADMRAGIIASTVANCARTKNRRSFKPKDFMPQYDKHLRKQGPDDMMMMFKQFVNAQNAYVEDKARKKKKR